MGVRFDGVKRELVYGLVVRVPWGLVHRINRGRFDAVVVRIAEDHDVVHGSEHEK